MDESKIQEALKTLHGTHALVSKICWSMEDKYSIEDIEKIQNKYPMLKVIFLVLFLIEII